MLATPEFIFFFDTTKRCAKERFLSWSESDLKTKSLKYEENEKLAFEISIRVKKQQNNFSQNYVLAQMELHFFSRYNKKNAQ